MISSFDKQDLEKKRQIIIELLDNVRNQIVNLEDIRTNYLISVDHNEIPLEFVVEMIDFMNENYYPVPQYQTITSDSIKLYQSFYWLYEFYVIDFPENILYFIQIDPKISKMINEYESDEFEMMVKNFIVSSVRNHLVNISKLKMLEPEKIKWTFYLDVVDNDTRNFINNYLIKLYPELG